MPRRISTIEEHLDDTYQNHKSLREILKK